MRVVFKIFDGYMYIENIFVGIYMGIINIKMDFFFVNFYDVVR